MPEKVNLRHAGWRSLPTLLCVVGFLGLLVPSRGAVAENRPDKADFEKADKLRKDLRRMIELARDEVFPALVNIHVSTVNYWGGKERKGAATGSGTIISPEGYVVTNQHVTNKGKKFKCTLADKQEISATMIGEDPLTDLAVIKLDLSELKSPGTPLPVASFGDSDELEIGDYVMAMGSPHSLSRSVTLGIVSNTERVFGGGPGDDVEEMELEQGQRTGLFTRWIQHDALIRPGNSGGPLVNLKGEIVGVNELGGNGMGFAIPSTLAKQVTASLIEHGEVPRSWIGVSFKPIAKTGYDKGVLVNSVVDNSPADKAELKPGDVILRINGEALTIRFAEEIPPLMKRIADERIGSSVKVTYQREGASAETTLVTEKLEKDRGQETVLRSWGITAEEITSKIAREWRLGNREGVMISGTRSGGPAELAEPALQYGDIIRKIDGQPVVGLSEMVDRYEEIMEMDPLPEYLLVEFDRSAKNHVTLVKPKPDEDEDQPRDIKKAWIGIATQPIVQKLAKQLGHPSRTGFRITRVYPRTKAFQSDLKVGDIVTALNGEDLRLKGMQDAGLLSRKIKKLDIDEEAKLTVLRNGEAIDVTVTLEPTRWTPSEARRLKNRDFEMTIRNITFFDRDDNQWDGNVKGVIIEQIENGGWAGLGGLRVGDLIQRIDEHVIKSRKSFQRAMKKITEEQPERVVFVVLRGIQTRFQYVEPEWKPAELDDKKKKMDNQDRANADQNDKD
ncbi:MAG: PDZ domain-containing protein [Phycisphaerales bacterium]|nr:PDZ domain-containing protein [Phycisphaerales bacterium]